MLSLRIKGRQMIHWFISLNLQRPKTFLSPLSTSPHKPQIYLSFKLQICPFPHNLSLLTLTLATGREVSRLFLYKEEYNPEASFIIFINTVEKKGTAKNVSQFVGRIWQPLSLSHFGRFICRINCITHIPLLAEKSA